MLFFHHFLSIKIWKKYNHKYIYELKLNNCKVKFLAFNVYFYVLFLIFFNMFYKSFEAIKYKFIRYIESNYKINLLIYNNIHLFKFLLPHEKDYYGMLLICKNNKKSIILDIGASLGISSFRF